MSLHEGCGYYWKLLFVLLVNNLYSLFIFPLSLSPSSSLTVTLPLYHPPHPRLQVSRPNSAFSPGPFSPPFTGKLCVCVCLKEVYRYAIQLEWPFNQHSRHRSSDYFPAGVCTDQSCRQSLAGRYLSQGQIWQPNCLLRQSAFALACRRACDFSFLPLQKHFYRNWKIKWTYHDIIPLPSMPQIIPWYTF